MLNVLLCKCIYTPTNEATEKENVFYFELQGMIDETPKHDIVILMDDLNTKVGGSREEKEEVIVPFTTTEETNEMETLVDLFVSNNLFLSNTFFEHKVIYNNTWISSEGKSKNAIGFICESKKWMIFSKKCQSLQRCRDPYRSRSSKDRDQSKT